MRGVWRGAGWRGGGVVVDSDVDSVLVLVSVCFLREIIAHFDLMRAPSIDASAPVYLAASRRARGSSTDAHRAAIEWWFPFSAARSCCSHLNCAACQRPVHQAIHIVGTPSPIFFTGFLVYQPQRPFSPASPCPCPFPFPPPSPIAPHPPAS